MMRSMKARWGIVATMAVALALTLSSPTAGNARGATNNGSDDSEATGFLTAIWWQWLYSVPLPESPGFDTTGEYAFENQPFDDLVFLAGTFTQLNVGNDVHGVATRSITVERGTAFFFPLVNTEFDNVMFNTPKNGTASVVNNPRQGGLTIPQLQAGAASSVDAATGLFCTLTPAGGKSVDVPYERVQSPVFAYFLPEDNIYEAYDQTIEGIVWPAVSDGYWSYIPPLPQGRYTLHFGGQFPLTGGTFYLDITYHITVK